ncbi:MAG: lactate racemase domain-containing protein [Candidatus Latescibacterota bacterium]
MDKTKITHLNEISRRKFIRNTGISALLIGNAFNKGTGIAETVRKPNTDRYQSISLTTHEWYGDIDERLDLPKEWKVETLHNGTLSQPQLTIDEMRKAIRNPIGTKPLRDIAAGKKTAVILFDDLSRPTPANTIAPLVIEELHAGGIKDENILFISMIGSHWAMTHDQVLAKLGFPIVDKYPWINHNVFDNFAKLGKTSGGIPVEVNYYFYTADVKVAIGNLKKHGHPGYSGGAKAIIPGVSSIDSIQSFHTNTMDGKLGSIFHNKSRDNMEEYAYMAGLDFVTQSVCNGHRNIIRLWSGDLRAAFRRGVPEAAKLYETTPVKDADVVIANAYPYTIEEWGKFDWANWSLRQGGTAIAIFQMPLGRVPMHYWGERSGFRKKSYWDSVNIEDPVPNAGQIIIYSQYLHRRDLHYPEGRVKLCRTWDEVLKLVEKKHGAGTRCAVYPYVGIQHEPITVDQA